ncbi:dynamin family protein [Calidifontibacillus erzurumensis]|uniref:Dynamin family protein n=1 Tax=Calidifontibacillus erzurumensis TaxID=2741433 RepID=A0A8J8GHU0_9BACI|nr:dynamin family protein [Calidifontibacillus erzurumensis]NSL52653.1 dynamin family protein [Calidifontibacillus erzurumensis]
MLEMNRLTAIYMELDAKGDLVNAEKVKQLIDKLRNNEFTIAFCGHFSAGKSTMMNQLMGKDVLPSSPIPTSANLVKIKKGKSYARVYYKNADPVEFPAPYDYEVVKNFAKDGETIESIEISDEDIKLPEGVAIMDTPGIDSTDDAHRIATESALHLADVVFYVMDYNHVQSELNFSFTKTLKDRGKPVYLIINMIDKHNEAELSFHSYKSSVVEAFKTWGVNIDGIFYTSLKDFSHPENEYAKLEQFLISILSKKDELLLNSVMQAAKQLIEDHLQFFDDTNEEVRKNYEAELEHLSEQEKKLLLEELASLEETRKNYIDKKINLKDEFENGLKKILDNAYLMPAATRDLAHSYVEAAQPDFKVGFLFAKKKTEEERKARLQAFYESFKKQVESQLDWHLKDFAVKFFKQNKVDHENFIQTIYEELTVSFQPDLLQSLVKKSAGVTGEYILNYTNDVSNELKRLYKNRALDIFVEGKKLFDPIIDTELNVVEDKLESYRQYKGAVDGLKALNEKRKQVELKLLGLLTEPLLKDVLDKTDRLLKEWNECFLNVEIKQMEMKVSDKETVKSEQLQVSVIQEVDAKVESTFGNVLNADDFNVKNRLEKTVTKLNKALGLLQGIKGIHTLAHDMAEKAIRLSNQRFTVALFGAFSAGKSSFANALIGEKLLPVSPNPTTATINKILPANEDYPHGTVLVKIKTEEQIFRDVEQSLALFQKKCHSMDEALTIIQSLSYDGNDPKEKPHYSFLKAVQIGYDFIKNHLGELLTVDLKGFEEYVAKEEKSCFVEWIELYYDCPLTAQGITLVDTPGADSINARHTGVAFEYIKNADAILFVTYYNHAFSKADREFLIQLGRVKEAFELDKMFFIVNAADLAKSEEELKLVVDYVGDELKKFGIRFPRIYPLSSKLALEEKLAGSNYDGMNASRIAAFEHAFHSFIMNDLLEISIQSAHEDIKRSVAALDNMIAAAKESDEIKQLKKMKAEQAKSQIIEQLETKEFIVEERSLIQEIEELLFYVSQRSFFRFNDFYNEAFNPSSLRDDGRDLKKAVQGCLEELLGNIGFDLSQEMRATSLRVENHINKLLKDVHGQIEKMIAGIHPISLLPPRTRHFDTMEFDNAFAGVKREPFQASLSTFKNPKSFFEQGGKQKLKEQLEQLVKSPVQSYVEKEKTHFIDVYRQLLLEHMQEMIKEIIEEVNDYFEGYLAALSETIDIEKLEDVKINIETIIKGEGENEFNEERGLHKVGAVFSGI